MKQYFGFLLVLFVLTPSPSRAQFTDSSFVMGMHIGVSNVVRATVLGVKCEPSLAHFGPGELGLGGTINYYAFNAGELGTQTYIFMVASISYHLRLDEGSFDPFIGVGAGYLLERNTFPATGGISYYNTDGSGFKPVLSIGARYFLSPSFAIRMEFGSSLVYAVGGVDFGF